MPSGRAKISWAKFSCVLIIAQFCHPKSEIYVAGHYYGHTALANLTGVPDNEIYDNHLYLNLDKLFPIKQALEEHLKERFGQLFKINYDLLLYNVTSTIVEGQAENNPQAKLGYSRDKRPDCQQKCIALVVTKEGIPMAYEIFDSNLRD